MAVGRPAPQPPHAQAAAQSAMTEARASARPIRKRRVKTVTGTRAERREQRGASVEILSNPSERGTLAGDVVSQIPLAFSLARLVSSDRIAGGPRWRRPRRGEGK